MNETIQNITSYNIVENIKNFRLTDLLTLDVIIPVIIILATPIIANTIDHAFFHLETKSMTKQDLTRQRMARSVIKASVYILGLIVLMFSIPPLRALSVGMFAGVGLLSIVIGLAAQDSLSNIFAGMSLVIFQPFRIGDRVKISNEEGKVEDITLRHTVIKTWDNKRIIIPNHILGKELLTNYTIKDEKIVKYVDMSISYDSDIDFAKKIMIEELEKNDDYIELMGSSEIDKSLPVVRVKNLGDSGVTLSLIFWTGNEDIGLRMTSMLLEAIKKRFDKEGIEIPFPYRTIVYKKDMPKPKTLKASKK